MFHCSVPVDDITPLGNGDFTVQSFSRRGKHYTVKFSEPKCTCDDWCTHGYPCKHFFAVFRLIPGWDWSALPEQYRTSPRMVVDAGIVAGPDDVFGDVTEQPAAPLLSSGALDDDDVPNTGDEVTTADDELPIREVRLWI